MLTDELRGVLQAAADQQPFEPNVAGLPVRIGQLRRRRVAIWVSAGAASIGVITTAGVLVSTGSTVRISPAPLDKGSAALVQEVEHWGPTRGSYAHNQAFIERVKQAWLNPPAGYAGDPGMSGTGVLVKPDGTKVVMQPDRSRHLTGEVMVLYAGQTPDGPAAVVAQRTTLKDAGMYLGYLLPTNDHDLQLVSANTPKDYPSHEFDQTGFDTTLINFKTSTAGDHLVVLPADPADAVSVSLGHRFDVTGHVQRDWSPVLTTDGVGMVDATGPLGFWDALIRVQHDGALVDETPANDVLAASQRGATDDAQPPKPPNFVDWPLSDQEIGGSVPGGGYVSSLNDPWITQYATSDEPYGSQWWVSGSPQDRHMIVVTQLWFYGDPAHTVVLRVVDKNVQLLSDAVTDPTKRPLVFVHLPDALGWLVVGGPDTTITGWRETGTTTWSAIDTFTAGTTNGKPDTTNKATFIRSTADHIQVRLDVNGKTQVASK